MEFKSITLLTKEKPKNKLFKVRYTDKTEEEYISYYLYNISNYFKMIIDQNQTFEFNESLKEIIYSLSINDEFKIDENNLLPFVMFVDYIQSKLIFEQIYDYIYSNHKLEHIKIIPFLFNHISQQHKIKLYEKINNHNYFLHINNKDLLQISLHCRSMDSDVLTHILTKFDLNEHEQLVLQKKINKIKKYFEYKLFTYNQNYYLEYTYTTLTGENKSLIVIDETYRGTLNYDYYFHSTNGNPPISEAILIKKLSKTKYNEIIYCLRSSTNFHLMPIIDKCIIDQNIEIIDE